MTLWVLSYAEKSKIILMAIKDRMKQPLYVAELHLKDSYKGPRPHKIRLLTGKQKEEFIPPPGIRRVFAQCKQDNARRRREPCK